MTATALSSKSNFMKRKSLVSAAALGVAAPLVFLALFFLLPLLWIVYNSIGPADAPLAHYRSVFSSVVYLRSFAWTLQLALVTSILSVVLGYPTAYAIAMAPPRRQTLLLLCIILPFWTSALVRAYSWVAILGREGIVNGTMTGLGIWSDPAALVFNPLGAVIGTTHIMIPYVILCLYTNMRSIDSTLMRAAASLGANRMRAFFLVYVPQTVPGLTSGFVLVFIISLGFFVTPAVLGGTQSPTISVLIEQNITKLLDWSQAATLASILLVATLVLYAFFNKQVSGAFNATRMTVSGATSFYRAFLRIDQATAFLRRARPAHGKPGLIRRFLQRARLIESIGLLVALVSAAPMVLIVLIALFPSPSLSIHLSNFSLRWFGMYFTRFEWLHSTWVSLVVAAGAAVLTSVLVLAIALGMRRLSQTARALIIPVCLSPVIVPTVVYGLAAYFLFARMGLIGTKLSMMLAHAVIAVPAAFLVMLAGIQSLDGRLEDAAASLGASPWKRLRYVVIPILSPVMVIGALIAFLVSFDDLNIALFLASGNTKTLPKLMYDSILFDNDPRVNAASAVLIGVTVVMMSAIHLLRTRSAR